MNGNGGNAIVLVHDERNDVSRLGNLGWSRRSSSSLAVAPVMIGSAKKLLAQLPLSCTARLLLRESEHFCGWQTYRWRLSGVRLTRTRVPFIMFGSCFSIGQSVTEAFWRRLPIKPLTKAGAKGRIQIRAQDAPDRRNLAVRAAHRSDDASPWAAAESS